MKKLNFKVIIPIIIIIVIACFLLYQRLINVPKPDGIIDIDRIPTKPKVYEINEYHSLSISDQEMCEKYLNNYLYILSTDARLSYNLLDPKYRESKFGNIDNFIKYIEERYNTYTTIDKYYVGQDIYYIFDKNGNEFIFSTKGVMSYKVFLDEDTVQITKLD